jgi:O-phosphoseryl-tRNA(Cys) synthetase
MINDLNISVGETVNVIEDSKIIARGVISKLISDQWKVIITIDDKEFSLSIWGDLNLILANDESIAKAITRADKKFFSVVDKKYGFFIDSLPESDIDLINQKINEIDEILSRTKSSTLGISYASYQGTYGNSRLNHKDILAGQIEDIFNQNKHSQIIQLKEILKNNKPI